VERLHISTLGDVCWDWQDIESSQWLELLHRFTAVKDIYVSDGVMSDIAPALQELVGERATEVFTYLSCKLSFWKCHTRQDQSRKLSSSLLPPDSLPVNPFPFVSGK
jgi:hypothetical protein